MLCYLARMEPYYLKCIKDGPFQSKLAEGDAKHESQWTFNERRVVVQDQLLKSIIMSCLPDDIMESIISCVSTKEIWTDLVHNFEGPLETKENIIMDLKLEYQTFRTKSDESLSQTYTRYKTLLNELANDGVNLSKHEIYDYALILRQDYDVTSSLRRGALQTFSQGPRNANHTQTLDLADIYRRFVYEDNLIQRRYPDTKKVLITTPSSSAISTDFFSNNVIQDFQENFDDEVDERSSEEYLRDLETGYHERALLANSKRFVKRRNNLTSQKANENTECYKCGNKDFIIMSNTNNNMQTQTSNTLHNDIMEAGSKDHPPMLAPGNYVQWKSRIKRYIDTKPNHEVIHYCLTNPPYELGWIDKEIPISEGSPITRYERFQETYKNVSQEIRDQLNAEAEAVQIILTGIDNDIYSIVDACLNACEMWKEIERLKQGESINVQDLETNLYWEFGKFTSQDVLTSTTTEWQRFVTLVKQNQELKTVSYHKIYDILKQHQHKVNEIRAEKIARVPNPLALVAQQQPVYHPQTHPTHYTKNSSTRSQQAATKNRGKVIVNSPQPIYDQEPSMVTEDDETSQDKEIDKLMALISLSFKKIYKPTNNNLRTSSNTSRANQD
nr:retrovirus-related Pol polyprotein from transposon TNT 1-94 [Tanacetum cinerariifolium]